MEKFLLSTFSDTLSQYIVGFHPDQINANLLVGKGEITNVVVNVDTINSQVFSKLTSKLRLKSAQITKLSFNVTSFTNLKKSPIIVTIDEINMILEEPLEYKAVVSTDTSSIKGRSAPKRRPYGLAEKIQDNVTFVVSKVNINFQPMGKFKTKRYGEWTPPQLFCQLKNVRYELTDEFGETGSPEIIWRNTRVQRREDKTRSWMVYKRCQMNFYLGLNTSTEPYAMTHPLIRDCNVETHVAIKRRLNDSGYLDIQVDVSVNDVEIDVQCDDVPIISHALAGLKYCFAKNRSFQDPLLPDVKQPHIQQNNAHVEIKDVETERPIVSETPSNTDNIESNLVENSLEDDESFLDDSEQDDDNDDDVENNDIEEDEEEDEEKDQNEEVEEDDEENISNNDEDKNIEVSNQNPLPKKKSRKKKPRELRPKLLLKQTDQGPIFSLSSITIFESLTLSLSVHHCHVRASYGNQKGGNAGHFSIVLRGLITEIILDKERELKKGHFQFSLSCLTIQDRLKGVTYPILNGGFEKVQNMNCFDPNKPTPILIENINIDESFPLFEDRSVREDPVQLRHSFPVQAIGIKTSINMNQNSTDPFLEHEVGISNIELILDSVSFHRAICHFGKHDSRYDPRWHTGDWGDLLTPIILSPEINSFVLEEYLQSINSSDSIIDFFSDVTVKGNFASVRLPAAIKENIQNISDIVVSIDDFMVITSTALPRDFLDGKVTGYTNEFTKYPNSKESKEKEEKEVNLNEVQYPNERGDLCYDALIGEWEANNTNNHRNPRVQVTMKSFNIEIKPIPPFLQHIQTKKILSLTRTILLLSMDHFDDSFGTIVFISSLIRSLDINLDPELLATAIGTVNYHNDIMEEIKFFVSSLENASTKDILNKEDKQDELSIQLMVCLHMKKGTICLWRHSVPLESYEEKNGIDIAVASAVLVCQLGIEEFEMGFESRQNFSNSFFSTIQSAKLADSVLCKNFLVVKVCVAAILMEVCDSRFLTKPCLVETDGGSDQIENEHGEFLEKTDLITIFVIGRSVSDENLSNVLHQSGLPDNDNKVPPGFSMRVEIWESNSTDLFVSAKLSRGMLHLNLDAVNNAATIFIQSLLLPHSSSFFAQPIELKSSLFPPGSVGALFESNFINPRQERNEIRNMDQNEKPKSETNFTGCLLSKISIDNFAVVIQESPKIDSDPISTPSFAGVLTHLDFSVASFPSSFVNQPSVVRDFWENMLRDTSPGMHVAIQSNQCLNLLSTQTENEKKQKHVTTIIPIFGIDFRANPSSINAGLQNSNIICESTMLMKRFQQCLKLYKARVEDMKKRFSCTFRNVQPNMNITIPFTNANDLGTLKSIQSARTFLKKIGDMIVENGSVVQVALFEKQKILDDIRSQLFTKERQRIALLSILSHNCSGWMRVGHKESNGQRVLTTATLSKYWVILRHSLIVIFTGPGVLTPKEIIPISGAQVHLMITRRRKVDEKRGFILTEANGRQRIFVVASGIEHDMWAQSLSKAIRPLTSGKSGKKSQEGDNVSDKPENMSQPDLNIEDSLNPIIPESSPAELVMESTSIDDKLSDDEMKRSNVDEENENEYVTEENGKTKLNKLPTQQQLKNRLSSVKSISGAKFSKFGASLKSVSRKENTQEPKEMNNDLGIPETDVHSNEEFETVDLEKPQDFLEMDPNDEIDNQKTVGQSRREMIRGKMPSKMPSINVNAKISKIGSAVKSVRPVNHRFPSTAKMFHGNRSAKSASAIVDEEPNTNQAPNKLESASDDNMSSLMAAESNFEMEFDTIDLDASNHEMLHAITEGVTDITLGGLNSAQDSADFSNFVDDSVENTENAENAENTVNSLNRREQLRRKMGKVPSINMNSKLSKISSAVMSVRPNSDTIKHLNSNSYIHSGKNLTSKLSLKNAPTAGKSNEDKIKWKDMEVSAVPIDPLDFETKEDRMEIISGSWIVSVALLQEEFIPSAPPEGQKDQKGPTNTQLDSSNTESASSDILLEQYPSSSTESETKIVDSTAVMKSEENALFEIKIVCSHFENYRFIKIVKKTFSDIIALHTKVSEDVSHVVMKQNRIASQTPSEVQLTQNISLAKETLTSEMGLEPLHQVRFTGRLLQGLLNIDPFLKNDEGTNSYRCEILAEFLNSCLESPIPPQTRDILMEFFDIQQIVEEIKHWNKSDPIPFKEEVTLDQKGSDQTFIEISNRIKELGTLTSACHSELISAIQKQDQEKQEDHRITNRQQIDSVKPALLKPLSNNGNRGQSYSPYSIMHNAIMTAMSERDEMQAHLIASNVLHTHELSQEQRKSNRLLERCRSFERHMDGGISTGNAFFNNPQQRQRKIANEMQQDTDAELLALCKQLSSEISGRTSASMEVIRLKESRTIELEGEKAEKEALKDEIKNLKKELEEARKDKKDALENSLHWKTLYENVTK